MSELDGVTQPTTAPTTTTPTPEATPTSAASPWYHAIQDAEIRGALETKGWAKLDPTAAAAEAVKAHRNAEKMLGAPADHLVRLPTRTDDEAGWRQVWQKLGAPEKPEDYDLTGIDLDDADMTSRFHQAIRQTAAELNVPKAMAERMAQTFHKFISDAGAATQAEQSAALQAEQGKLEADWGRASESRFKANAFVADRAMEHFGLTPEAQAKLKEGIGAAEVAKLFHKIGIAMGEDRYVSGQNPTQQGVMSREQAFSRRAELMSDREWVSRYLAGGAPEKREMLAINTMIAGA